MHFAVVGGESMGAFCMHSNMQLKFPAVTQPDAKGYGYGGTMMMMMIMMKIVVVRCTYRIAPNRSAEIRSFCQI